MTKEALKNQINCITESRDKAKNILVKLRGIIKEQNDPNDTIVVNVEKMRELSDLASDLYIQLSCGR